MLTKLRTSLNWLRSPYALLDSHLARGELSFRLNLPVLGNSLVTGDPAHIAAIVRNRDLIGGRGTQALRPVVGDHSLIVLEGDAHERHRNLMLPHFFSGDFSQYDALTRKWTRAALHTLPAIPFSGMQLMAGITLNVIIEVLFGTLPAKQHQHAVALVKRWLASFSSPAILFLKPLHINLGPYSGWGRFLRNRAALHHFIADLIRETEQALASGAGTSPDLLTPGQASGAPLPGQPAYRGVLAALLAQRRQGGLTLSDAELISQMVTFLLFGHDTSAAAMGWFFHYVWRDPACLQSLQQEQSQLGAGADPEHMPLLRSALFESMRLSPVVVHLTPHALRATQVGEWAIASGQRVLPCMYLAQRNPALFPEPQRFDPRRFLQMQPEWRYGFFPFGLGNRLCAGMPFAQRQMLLLASEVLQSVPLVLHAPESVQPKRHMVLIVPSGGPLLRVAS